MTRKDKTRGKLVGSMRKTKADAGVGADTAEPATAAEPVAPASPAGKPATNRKVAAAPAFRAADATGDTYQCGRRIWPD